jgi:pSer/pThr/pTyr-binding forkhead associated (FHA) protein
LCAGRTALLLTQPVSAIGRGEECEIVLDGDTVSRRHCEIIRLGAAYFLSDASRNGTFINGERVQQAQLHDGDQVRVGQNILLISLASGIGTSMITGKPTAPHRLPPGIELKPHIVVKGLEEGVTQPFSEDRITIGRRADNHVVLEADNISRQHVSIERRDGRYCFCDLGSANGVFLNDQRADFAQLNDGDRLRVGNYTIAVCLIDQDCILNFKRITK